MAKEKNNYINNKTFCESLIKYRAALKDAQKNKRQPPQVSPYIGECIVLICRNLSKRPNFSAYSAQYLQEMISDAILDCIAAVDNFDPAKSNNPFAYFTQIAWYAYIRRIQREKKQTYIKHKNFENMFLMNEIWGEEGEFMQLNNNDLSDDVIRSFEDKNLTKNNKQRKLKGLEKFQENQENEKPASSTNQRNRSGGKAGKRKPPRKAKLPTKA